MRSCPPLSRPQHGFLRCNDGGSSKRAECQVGCERGYRLDGDSRLTCQANSQWSGPQPRCVGKPSSPPNHYFTVMCYIRNASVKETPIALASFVPEEQPLPYYNQFLFRWTVSWFCSKTFLGYICILSVYVVILADILIAIYLGTLGHSSVSV